MRGRDTGAGPSASGHRLAGNLLQSDRQSLVEPLPGGKEARTSAAATYGNALAWVSWPAGVRALWHRTCFPSLRLRMDAPAQGCAVVTAEGNGQGPRAPAASAPGAVS